LNLGPPRAGTQRAGTSPRLTLAKQALFSVVALLLILALVEGGVRLYHFARSLGTREEPRGYVVDDPSAGYTLKPGFEDGGIRVNSLGFRGPDVAREKPSGTYRIAALGDSATFGPHEEECAYPYLLPVLLAPKRVEVINAAVEGYRADRALVHLKRDVLPLQPDLVTVFIGWNDLYQSDPRAENEQLSTRGNPLARLLTLSDAAQTFRRLYFLRFNTQRAQTSEIGVGNQELLAVYRPVGYEERLREMFRVARAAGAEVVALTWPTILADSMTSQAIARVHYPWYTTQLGELRILYARYQEALRRVAVEERVPVIDIAAVFESRDKVMLFKDTAHFNCEGQALVAENVALQLREWKTPPKGPKGT
jgi:lysophospholipase L1-like esterase